jgi:DNA processing protein
VVVSQFSPGQPWNAGAAMARNAVISGLSRALVVVEAGDTGGTLAAGLHALERGQPVIVLQLDDTPAGNRILLDKGAIPVRSRQELASRLADLPTAGSTQMSLI